MKGSVSSKLGTASRCCCQGCSSWGVMGGVWKAKDGSTDQLGSLETAGHHLFLFCVCCLIISNYIPS